MRKVGWSVAGGVGAAFLGAICCIGPLLFVTIGIGAGLASTFEPLRPIFGVIMVVLFGVAAYTVYRKPRPAADGVACVTEDSCALPDTRGRDRKILWSAGVIALVLWTFPTWSVWLL